MDATKQAEAEAGVTPLPTDGSYPIEESDMTRRALERRLVRKLDIVILPMLCMSSVPNPVDIGILCTAIQWHLFGSL